MSAEYLLGKKRIMGVRMGWDSRMRMVVVRELELIDL
jgi:hypothetical protein